MPSIRGGIGGSCHRVSSERATRRRAGGGRHRRSVLAVALEPRGRHRQQGQDRDDHERAGERPSPRTQNGERLEDRILWDGMVLVEPADDAVGVELQELRVRAQEGPGVDRGGELLERGVRLERVQVPLPDPRRLRGVRHGEPARLPRLAQDGRDTPGRHRGRALDLREIDGVDPLAGDRRWGGSRVGAAPSATSAGGRSCGQRRPHDRQSHSSNGPTPPVGGLPLRSWSTFSDGPPGIAGTTRADPQRGHSMLGAARSRPREITMARSALSGRGDTVQRPCVKKEVVQLRRTVALASETPAMGCSASTLGSSHA